MFDLFALGFKAIFQPYPLILLFLGTVAGIVVGCIPGFTITMGAALVLPLTFGMTSIQGLAAMIGVLVADWQADRLPAFFWAFQERLLRWQRFSMDIPWPRQESPVQPWLPERGRLFSVVSSVPVF